MEKIKFSVLMSVYYKETKENLKIAIDSILNQTVLPNEFIIVEDGPLSEELNSLIDDYEKKYEFIKIVKLNENHGLGEALKQGIKHCKYDYIARMDSDDFSLPNRFAEQISYLQKNPNIDLLGSYVAEYDEELKEQISIKKVPIKPTDIKEYMKKRNPFNHPTVIFKKKAVLNSGNYEKMLYFEDYYLWCKMFNNGCNITNIDKVLLNFRAGKAMYKRRGGLTYTKAVINFEKSIMKLGIINKFEFAKICFIRISVTILPSFLRELIYKKKLRN